MKTIDGGLTGLAPRPAHIPKCMHKEWDLVVADLAGRKLLTASMLGVVATYVTALFEVANCVEAIERDGAFTLSRSGEPKSHPALGVLNKANETVARLGAELGLTPAARSRKALQGPGEDADEGAPAGLDL